MKDNNNNISTDDLYIILDQLSRIMVLEHRLLMLIKSLSSGHPMTIEQEKAIKLLSNAWGRYDEFTKPR